MKAFYEPQMLLTALIFWLEREAARQVSHAKGVVSEETNDKYLGYHRDAAPSLGSASAF